MSGQSRQKGRPVFLSDQQVLNAIIAIEGAYPPEHSYAIEVHNKKMATFTQFKGDGEPQSYLLLFTWWGSAHIVTVGPTSADVSE